MEHPITIVGVVSSFNDSIVECVVPNIFGKGTSNSHFPRSGFNNIKLSSGLIVKIRIWGLRQVVLSEIKVRRGNKVSIGKSEIYSEKFEIFNFHNKKIRRPTIIENK